MSALAHHRPAASVLPAYDSGVAADELDITGQELDTGQRGTIASGGSGGSQGSGTAVQVSANTAAIRTKGTELSLRSADATSISYTLGVAHGTIGQWRDIAPVVANQLQTQARQAQLVIIELSEVLGIVSKALLFTADSYDRTEAEIATRYGLDAALVDPPLSQRLLGVLISHIGYQQVNHWTLGHAVSWHVPLPGRMMTLGNLGRELGVERFVRRTLLQTLGAGSPLFLSWNVRHSKAGVILPWRGDHVEAVRPSHDSLAALYRDFQAGMPAFIREAIQLVGREKAEVFAASVLGLDPDPWLMLPTGHETIALLSLLSKHITGDPSPRGVRSLAMTLAPHLNRDIQPHVQLGRPRGTAAPLGVYTPQGRPVDTAAQMIVALEETATGSGYQVRVDRIIEVDGRVRWQVFIPGTDGAPWDGSSPRNWADNVPLFAGLDTVPQRAVEQVMAQVGIEPGEEVVLFGHSQGGIIAANMSSDPAVRARYDVSGVVTVGSPISVIPPAHGVPLIAIEHVEDMVPGVDGAYNPVTPDIVTVSRTLTGSEHWSDPQDNPIHQLRAGRGEEVPDAYDGGAPTAHDVHDLPNYHDTSRMIDASEDSNLAEKREQIFSPHSGGHATTYYYDVTVP